VSGDRRNSSNHVETDGGLGPQVPAVYLDGPTALPPLHSVLHDVRVLIDTIGYLGIVVIDFSAFSGIELEFGPAVYNKVVRGIADACRRLSGTVLSDGDLMCVMAPFGEQIVLFMEGPRRKGEPDPRDLEHVVEQIWEALAPEVAAIVAPFGSKQTIRLGSSLLLTNVMFQPERLIYHGIEEARQMALDFERRTAARARTRLRDILVKRSLFLEFQPVVDMGTSGVFGYEALVRGPANLGMRSPESLFRLARTAHLSGELLRACVDQTYLSLGGLPSSSNLFMNITPALLYDPQFTRTVSGDSGAELPPTRVVVELAEWAAVRNFELVSEQFEHIRRLGVRLAIDDMGAGHSSLKHLIDLKPDFLKLDMSLIRDVDKDATKRAVIAGLMTFCRNTGAVLVAEGVEQAGERDALAELGVQLAQGFWFARPAREFWQPPR